MRNGMTGREYYDYGLYDDARFPVAAKRRFLGARRMATMYRTLNQGNWYGISDDKLLFYSLLSTLDLPYPRLYAVYHPGGRRFGKVPSFRDVAALAEFLRTDIPYPFFAKPVRGGYGIDAMGVVAFANNELIRMDGHHTRLDRLLAGDRVTRFGSVTRFGYLFQECLTPHPTLVSACGERLSSVRLIVILGPDGPRPLHAVWKIPTGKNMTDNFRHGASGNLLGYVDLERGVVERTIGGVEMGTGEVSSHPDTGVALPGITLPDWSRLLDIAMAGARALPGLRWQNWDIAMSSSGPVILELNANADIDLVQLAYGAGLNNAKLEECLGLHQSP